MPGDETRITLGHGSGGRLTLDLIKELFAPLSANRFLRPARRCRHLPRPGGPDRAHHRLLRGPAALLRRRGHRLPGSQRHRQRPGGGGRAAALPHARGDPRRRPAPRRPPARRRPRSPTPRRGPEFRSSPGDTKVVERGKGDGIFLNTAGVGAVRPGYPRTDRGPAPGDAILVSGPLGDHGAVILAARSRAHSRPRPGQRLRAGYAAGRRALRRRHRAARSCATPRAAAWPASWPIWRRFPGSGVRVEEAAVPLRPAVETVCAITGIDPWHLACEGRVVAVVAAEDAARALAVWRAVPGGEEAARIGSLIADSPGRVVLVTRYGGARLLLRPSAELLPRIC